VISGMLADDPDAGSVPVRQTDVLMQSAEDRRRVAQEALEFALTLAPPAGSGCERSRFPSR
jgi:hypothetical protein